MTKNKLQIAILFPDFEIAEWMFLLIDKISRSEHSRIALGLVASLGDNSLLYPENGSFKYALYRKYIKSDRNKYDLSPDAHKKRPIRDHHDLQIHRTAVVRTKKGLCLEPEAIKKIDQAECTVLISFIGANLCLEPTEQMNCAIWSLRQAYDVTNKVGPIGVWEFLENKYATGIALTAYTHQSNCHQVLNTSYSSTDKFGLHRSLNNIFWKVPFMVDRELSKLYQIGALQYYQNARNKFPNPLAKNQHFQFPTNWDMLLGLTKNYIRRFRKKIDRKSNFEQYILLFKMGSASTTLNEFSDFHRILPPKDRFWADPFLLQRNDKYYVFMEELIYENELGTIGLIEMEKDGTYSAPKMVLEKDYHLSYPFLIEENSELYMIPESNANRSIQLYKCVDFPLKWELEEIIMDNVQALDTTVYFQNGRYWMFTNMKEHPGISGYDELFLFYSDKLVGGKWSAHPQNPIVSDVRSARPAGNIFKKDNKLYRPAQNCAKRYGHGMQILEIKTLTTTDYEEEIAQSIYPDWAEDLRTTHTINHIGDLTIIDALIARRK